MDNSAMVTLRVVLGGVVAAGGVVVPDRDAVPDGDLVRSPENN